MHLILAMLHCTKPVYTQTPPAVPEHVFKTFAGRGGFPAEYAEPAGKMGPFSVAVNKGRERSRSSPASPISSHSLEKRKLCHYDLVM